MNANVLLGKSKLPASHRPIVNLLEQGVRRPYCKASPRYPSTQSVNAFPMLHMDISMPILQCCRHNAVSRQLWQECSRTSFPASVSKSTQRGNFYICPLRSHSNSKAFVGNTPMRTWMLSLDRCLFLGLPAQ